jgi:hypothetical protein
LAAGRTSSLHLNALADLKRVNSQLVKAAAYSILRQHGELRSSRARRYQTFGTRSPVRSRPSVPDRSW